MIVSVFCVFKGKRAKKLDFSKIGNFAVARVKLRYGSALKAIGNYLPPPLPITEAVIRAIPSRHVIQIR